MSADPIRFKLEDDVGVVLVPGLPESVVYHLREEFDERTEAYQGGGTITQRVRTGRRVIDAVRYMGMPTMPLTVAIEAAVRADCAKRGIELA